MASPLRTRTRLASARDTGSVNGERLDALRDQLEELMLSQGFRGLTVDVMAAELQCSKSTLYAIAPSKEQLVVTILKRFFRRAAAEVDASVADIDDPATRIAAYLAAVGEAMRKMSVACFEDMIRSDVTRDVYDKNSRAAAEWVRAAIRTGIKKKVFRPLHAAFVGEAVSLLIEAIQEGSLLDRTGLSSGDAFAELSTIVVGALSAP